MEKLIKDYELLYDRIVERIETLQTLLNTEALRNRERDRLTARIDALEEERFDLVQTIYEMRKHL